MGRLPHNGFSLPIFCPPTTDILSGAHTEIYCNNRDFLMIEKYVSIIRLYKAYNNLSACLDRQRNKYYHGNRGTTGAIL